MNNAKLTSGKWEWREERFQRNMRKILNEIKLDVPIGIIK